MEIITNSQEIIKRRNLTAKMLARHLDGIRKQWVNHPKAEMLKPVIRNVLEGVMLFDVYTHYEYQILEAVARQYGWKYYHTENKKRPVFK